MTQEGRSRRRYLAFALVALAHLGIIVLCLRANSTIRRSLDRELPPLLLLYLPPQVRQRPGGTGTPVIPKPQRPPAIEPLIAPALPGGAPDAPAPANSPDSGPLVDWSGEQAQVAKSQSASILRDLKRTCHEAELRGEEKPECHKHKKAEAWSPEPRKFGIEGGLPYVRLGKRCILGLGFFGCAVGALPEANGHMLDDMRDLDRPHNSVPDPSE